MNWARGLFRLWLVASVLWIFAWIVLGWSTLGCFLLHPGPWCDYDDSRNLIGLAAIGLGTPVFLFFLGWALLWAFRGFHRAPQTTKQEPPNPSAD
jgi:hypothetical protein